MKGNEYNKHGYDPRHDEKEGQQQMQTQGSVVLSAYDKQVAQDIFFMTMEVLEKYIEKANYYSDWQTRKKIYDNKVTREFGSAGEAESVLSSNLVGLKMTLRDKPPFFVEELKEEYYKWINATGIDIGNISSQAERLKHWLFEVNEVLNGKGERFVEEVTKECREHVRKMSNEEYERKMNEAFVAYNPQLNKERGIATSLKDKTYKDVESERRFGGDNEKERGERAFDRIAGTVVNHGEFNYYQKGQKGEDSDGNQPPTNSEIVQDVKQNPQNWRIDEIITEFDSVGRAKQEIALIHQNARLDNYNQEGKLNFNGNPVYRWESFNVRERFEIKRAENISADYLTNDEIGWVVREIKSNPSVWRIEVIQGQIYLVHSSAQIKNNEIGTLIHSKQKFSNSEWSEIDKVLKVSDENRKITENIKNDVNSWKIRKIQGHDWLIHNRAQVLKSEIGHLLHPKQRFTDEEWFEIENVLNNRQSWVSRTISNVLPTNYGNRQNYNLDLSTSNSEIEQPQKGNNGIGVVGILVIIGVVSAVVIYSSVVVKKRLSKSKK